MEKLKKVFNAFFEKLKNVFKKREKPKLSFEEWKKLAEKREARDKQSLRIAKTALNIHICICLSMFIFHILCTNQTNSIVVWGVNFIIAMLISIRTSIYERIESSEEYTKYLISKIYELQIEEKRDRHLKTQNEKTI